jgi:hypothetical protein
MTYKNTQDEYRKTYNMTIKGCWIADVAYPSRRCGMLSSRVTERYALSYRIFQALMVGVIRKKST